MEEYIKIALEYEFPLITCKNCKAEFVTMFVTRSDEQDHEEDKTIWMAAIVTFCPLCGEKQN